MKKAKLIPLMLIAILFVAGCANQTPESSSADVTAANETQAESTPSVKDEVAESTSVAMEDLPCHKMPDGSLMGECPVDEFGNPYVPKESSSDHQDDPGDEAHLHKDDHEHADDSPPHRH